MDHVICKILKRFPVSSCVVSLEPGPFPPGGRVVNGTHNAADWFMNSWIWFPFPTFPAVILCSWDEKVALYLYVLWVKTVLYLLQNIIDLISRWDALLLFRIAQKKKSLTVYFTWTWGEIVMMLLQNDTFSPGLPDMLTATGNFVSASSDIRIYPIKSPPAWLSKPASVCQKKKKKKSNIWIILFMLFNK